MRSDEEVWTPLKLVDWTEKHFARNDVDQPRLEAEFLLAHVLGWERIDLYTRFEHTVEPRTLSRFRQLLKRRSQHVPRQYLTGTDEFYGLTLTVDERVLIPRNETEHLVEQTLEGVGSIYASPVGVADRVYFVGRGGVCQVIKYSDKFEVLATNTLEDGFDASPVIVGSELYLKGKQNLYCIASN